MRYLTLLLVTLALRAQPIQLSPVVVSATGESAPPIMGDIATLLDTPRAYSTIDRTTLEDYTLRLGGLSAFSSSVQQTGSYGHTATVNVRGDMAELYQNGQRRTNNAAGFQPSFNGVEQVDVIKGAAPVVFGPGFYSGGYLNLQTKRALPVRFAEYGVTIGALGEGYRDLTATFDVNQPASGGGIRVSYEGRKDDTPYRAGRDDTQDVYVTVHRYLPAATLDLSLEHLWEATPQVEGINRVTQELIDHRVYEADAGPRRLGATDNLISPGDFSNANVTTAQAIYAGTTVKAYTLVESVARRRFNAFAYAEYARQLTVDQRVEWHWDTQAAYTLVGVTGRYERRASFTNYFNAFFDAYDITLAGARDARTQPGYVEGTPGPGGRLFFGPVDGNSDTTLSHLYSAAPFAQQRLRLGAWQMLYGGRVDGYRVFVADPLSPARDDLTTYSVSRMVSVMRAFGPGWSAYATYGHLYSVNGTVSGGGIVLAPDLHINEGNLRSLNRLYEIGLRHEGFNVTAFWQARQQPDLYAYKPNDIVVRGVEVETLTSAGPWSAATSVTYQEGSFRNSLPFELPSPRLRSVSEPGDYRIPGLSRVYAASTLTCTPTST